MSRFVNAEPLQAGPPCPICGTPSKTTKLEYEDVHETDCQRCGKITTRASGRKLLERALRNGEPWLPDAMSHAVRQATSSRGSLLLTEANINQFAEARIPNAAEQANNLILWAGTQSADPSEQHQEPPRVLSSIMGCRSNVHARQYVLRECIRQQWIDEDTTVPQFDESIYTIRLTFAGWQRFEDLTRARVDSRRAFMAMQFNNSHLTAAFDCFKHGAKDAGFNLHILPHGLGAGLIDNQLRVAIRTARFLVVDLTTGNRGAYWEAGFAEGLGRPVIYVCEKSVMDNTDSEIRPHFDTSHLLTIKWEADKLDVARADLAATIRNTFPSDSIPPDDAELGAQASS